MKWFKEWVSNPVRVLNTLSVLLIGIGIGFLIKDYLL
jgi:hypothetical protein